jgi:hypothetical protein
MVPQPRERPRVAGRFGVAVAGQVNCRTTQRRITMLQAGDVAPLFVAPSTHGEIDLAGVVADRPTVLFFYPKAGTSG